MCLVVVVEEVRRNLSLSPPAISCLHHDRIIVDTSTASPVWYFCNDDEGFPFLFAHPSIQLKDFISVFSGNATFNQLFSNNSPILRV